MLFQALHQLQIFVSLCTLILHIHSNLCTAPINLVSANPINCSAVRVSWTPLNIPMVDHYTVHYTNIACSNMLSVTFPASASSGVVSGLQEGQQYQFSVSVSLLIGGQTFNSTSGSMTTTGYSYAIVCQLISKVGASINVLSHVVVT